MSHTQHRGFTLIELLIALSLLASVLVLGNYAYQTLAARWQTELDQFTTSQQSARMLVLYKELNDGILPLVISGVNSEPVIHFNGGPSGYIGASYNGISSTNAPVLFEVVIVESDTTGMEILEYSEISTDDFLLINANQALPYNQPINLLSEIDNARFRYFGATYDADEGVWVDAWHDTYNSALTRRLPVKIELRFEYEQEMQIVQFLTMNASEKIMGFYNQANDL